MRYPRERASERRFRNIVTLPQGSDKGNHLFGIEKRFKVVSQADRRSRFSSGKCRRASFAVSAPKSAPILEMIYSNAVPAAFLHIRSHLDRERSKNPLSR
jgi:hypothetical protein